jgi:poly-gamma-glutamate biosynthesis protein PgsC/CapC
MILNEAIAVGLLYGFFLYEWIGLSAGGFVVPGYIAVQMNNPTLLAGTLMVSFLTYATVKVASRFTILYGRRRFILMILAGFAWQWAFKLALIEGFAFAADDSLGFIIPGLIANEMERQGIWPTLLVMLTISIMVRLTLIALGLLRY